MRDDSAQHGVEPPEPELRAGWEAARRKRHEAEAEPSKLLAEWTANWLWEQEAREAPQVDYATRLETAIQEADDRWRSINKPGVEKITAPDLFLNFGRANETKRCVFLRLERHGTPPLARVSWEPAE